jgi:Na+-transporting NADH:ubiquinone oxidoreductase subunit F
MKNEKTTMRDYSLVGVETKKAIEMGLADAEWYQSPVPRDKMRELLERKDGPAILDTLLWFSLLFGSGYLVFLWWGSWMAVLPYIVYSVLYASTSDSRWHESSHGTAFKTDWMNNALYEIASLMVFRQSTVWRWSHTRHHSDTIIRGRDPEIAVPRPPKIRNILLGFVGLRSSIKEMKKVWMHATGRIDPQVATYLPETEYAKVIFKARIYITIYAFVIGLSIFHGSILPLMFIGLPTFFGGWLMPIYGLTQHAGLQENVLDHRLNCRTVYMNRLHRFLYWNMNYHVEHHMFPLVPYHALPKLHELVKDDCPTPYKSITAAFREIIPAILKQVKDPTYYVERKLPDLKPESVQLPNKVSPANPAQAKDGKVAVCTIHELAKGDVLRFDFRQKTYAVYRTLNNLFYATEGQCTHGNAHLSEGMVIGDMIECAKHNGRFSLTDGSPKRIPACVAIKTYKIELDGDMILLDLSGENNMQQTAIKSEKTFSVVSNRNVATFIKELELEPEDGEKFSFQPGQYVQFIIPPHKTSFAEFQIEEPHLQVWEKMRLFEHWAENTIYAKRNYSLATNPAIDKKLKFNIRISLSPEGKATSGGIGSSYVFALKSGDAVQLIGPFGDFHVKKSNREMVYLGGGAGMAPLRSHLSYLFETEKTNRKVSFWYGARSVNDIFYEDYFRRLEKGNANFTFHLALSEPDRQSHWNGPIGFIHEVLLSEYLCEHENPSEIEYYLCGPPVMIKAALKMLDDLGVDDNLISYDEF